MYVRFSFSAKHDDKIYPLGYAKNAHSIRQKLDELQLDPEKPTYITMTLEMDEGKRFLASYKGEELGQFHNEALAFKAACKKEKFRRKRNQSWKATYLLNNTEKEKMLSIEDRQESAIKHY
jgi:hypothetical protein